MPAREDVYRLVREHPDRSVRWIAKRVGVSHVTVLRQLEKLRQQGYHLPEEPRHIGIDGRRYPARHTAPGGTLANANAEPFQDIAAQAAKAPAPALDPPEGKKPVETANPCPVARAAAVWDW